MKHLELGSYGEELAFDYLKNHGFLIKERNFRRKWGEIDIVAYDLKTKEWVFFEVKTRKGNCLNSILPEEELTTRKIQKLKKVILSYLSFKKLENQPWRFDFLAIEFSDFQTEPIIRHYKNEFLEF